MRLFAGRVSPAVAQLYWDQRDSLLRNGHLPSRQLVATVLFTDLRNFTSISESMDPDMLMQWLNRYMVEMTQLVLDHGGHLDKIIGDAVMAVFGVPIPSNSEEEIGRDAERAVACAWEMRDRVLLLNRSWNARGWPEIQMRVGIFTGPLVAGTLGGTQRQEYTVIGDTVNTAARLESFDKDYDSGNPCRILVGETTRKYLDDRYPVQAVGSVTLKGKQREVAVFQVIGARAQE